LVPQLVNRIFTNPAVIPTVASDVNSLGIFAVAVPTTGVATGNYLFFNDGEAFFGTVVGVANPNTQKFTGLLAGSATTNSVATAEFLSPLSAVGNIKAAIESGSSVAAGTQGARLRGTAFIQLQGFVPDTSPNGFGFGTLREITFSVDGFRQSTDTGNVTIPVPNTQGITPPTTP
jgi:hypothetical protein